MTEKSEKGTVKQQNGAAGRQIERAWSKWNSFVDRLFGGRTVKERFLALCGLVFSALAALMLARMKLPFFSTFIPEGLPDGICYPFADAFLLSSGVYTPAVFAALIWHAYGLGKGMALRNLLLCGALALRIGTSLWLRGNSKKGRLFCESAVMKIGSASVFSLVSCGIYAIGTGLTLDTLAPTLVILLAPPILTAVMCGFFAGCPVSEQGENRVAERIYYELSMYFLFALCVYAASSYTFVGCSVSALLAIFLTLVVANRGGLIRGGLCGAVLGLIYRAGFAPALAAMGVFSGALTVLGSSVSLGICCAVGCVIAVLSQGYSAFTDWVPECIISVAVATPVLRYGFLSKRFPFVNAESDGVDAVIDKELENERGRVGVRKLYSISEAFSLLSGDYRTYFDAPKSTAVPDERILCEKLCGGFCDSCPMAPICWESEKARTEEAIRTFTAMYFNPKQKLGSAPAFPGGFHCIKPDALKKELTRLYGSDEVKKVKVEEKPIESFSEEYDCVSAMLKDIADSGENDCAPDTEAAARVRRAARALSFSPDAISVLGKRKKTVIAYGIDEKHISADTEKLREAFSKACGAALGLPVFSEEGGGRLTFEGVRRFSAASASAESRDPREEQNGDSAVSFRTGGGYYYSVISDGMGSGAEAAECAGIATSLAERLLKCEIKKELVVRMIGSAIRRRSGECFATVDMMELDLITGSASFLKSGAACSYIVRDGSVFCVSARSIPVGITAVATPEEVKFTLRDGDIIVMMSDGVAQDTEDGAWLIQLIGEAKDAEPEALANEILEKALALRRENGKPNNRSAQPEAVADGAEKKPAEPSNAASAQAEKQIVHDDMTVTVTKVKKISGLPSTEDDGDGEEAKAS